MNSQWFLSGGHLNLFFLVLFLGHFLKLASCRAMHSRRLQTEVPERRSMVEDEFYVERVSISLLDCFASSPELSTTLLSVAARHFQRLRENKAH